MLRLVFDEDETTIHFWSLPGIFLWYSGLIVAVIITQAISPPQADGSTTYSTYNGWAHVSQTVVSLKTLCFLNCKFCRSCVSSFLLQNQMLPYTSLLNTNSLLLVYAADAHVSLQVAPLV